MYRFIVLLMAGGLALGGMQASWAQPGATVQASGYGTRNAFGTVVDADAMTVGSQTIALR